MSLKNESFTFYPGNTPLLVSIPHVGTEIPDHIRAGLTLEACALPDTDWQVHTLYDFLPEKGVSVLQAKYSRYVVDLNRSPDGDPLYTDRKVTSICPSSLFDGQALYRSGCLPDAEEVARRVRQYWQPYHSQIAQELQRLYAQFGYAILWDAHSIKSQVPALFTGKLPDFNWGSAGGRSCAPNLVRALHSAVEEHKHYSVVTNGRFKGGYITQHFGAPGQGIHAVQLELSQATYLREESPPELDVGKVAVLKPLLAQLVDIVLKQKHL